VVDERLHQAPPDQHSWLAAGEQVRGRVRIADDELVVEPDDPHRQAVGQQPQVVAQIGHRWELLSLTC
jgi:hypothetical protein